MDVVIRPADRDEARRILDLQRLCYRSEAALYEDFSIPPMTQTLPELLAEYEDHEVLVAKVGDGVVGSVRARMEDGTCHVGRLAVHPRLQRRGIGSRLMRELEGCFPRAGRYELFTGHESEGNIRLYRRLGYEVVDERAFSPRVRLVYLRKEREG